ncbi:MAG TPA: ATP-binding protein, partial [Janthinobacterium sp.]|nr:ATP-binding protein [Janthinobacterium sp.]
YVATLLGVIERHEELARSGTPAPAAQMAAIRAETDLDFLRDDVTALVGESMDGLKRVRAIVQSLKDFSHVGETEWQIADLHAGLDSTLNIVANEIKYKARVEKQYGQLAPLRCLASQLNQVFMNLLINAGHAIAEHGLITIRTGQDGGWVWIEIGDNGVGIPQANLTRIFEPFFTTKPVGSGTGLGLSLSYGIVAKHGGRIDVESEPGKGTRFTVRLPIEPAA